MKTKAMVLVLAIAVCTAAVLGGCTVSNGVFTGMSQQSGDISLGASYVSFDGSLARSISLKEGDKVSFSYEGGSDLAAAVKQNGETLFEISSGAVYTVQADGQYAFVVEGKDKNGAFSLSWEID